ncbi:MAG TPA: AI-2E family transporter [Candidatus Sulfotelmatobacter sp.]|jgi:predicted PurR-regulated permease PerM|nr:AI-2E family transporter [Candidatus Sulfotelmatobacter sp.]
MLQRFYEYLLKNQVIFALCIIFFGWFIFQIRDIILSLFLSYIIMATILPIVTYLRKRHVPKLIAVLVPYFSILILLFALIIPLIPFVIQQLGLLISGFPKYLHQSADVFHLNININQLQGYLNNQFATLSSNALEVTTTLFGGLFSIITVFIVSLYLLLYNDSFKKTFARLFHRNQHEKVLTILSHVNEKLGAWFQGQILLSLTIGLLTWIALMLLGIPFALPLALLAGILEIVPTLGPTLSAIPAVIVALTISPTMALVMVVTYILIQMLENQLIVPKIMERAVGLNPVIVILGVTIGANLMGMVGALLSIPFISFVIVVYKSLEAQK